MNSANYFAALHICNLVNRYSDGKYNCVARASPGPVANIDQILAGSVAFGVTRSDYLVQAVNGTGIWQDDPQPILTALFSVHSDARSLVVCEDSDIRSVYDLKGRVVSLGILDSVDQQTATPTARTQRIRRRQRHRRLQPAARRGSSRAGCRRDRRLSCGRCHTGPGHRAGLGPDRHSHRRTQHARRQRPGRRCAHYQPTDIHMAYSSDLDPTDGLREAHAAFSHPEPEDMLQGLSAPFHPGAEQYYKEQGWM